MDNWKPIPLEIANSAREGAAFIRCHELNIVETCLLTICFV